MRNITTILLVLAALPIFAEDKQPQAPAPAPPLATLPATNPPGAKIQFAVPVYDFGKVQAGELVKYSYVFTNSGDQPLEVSNVQPSCGCTTAGDWSHKVMPGETGKVAIQFNSANFNGPVFKTVSVTSNDKQKPTFVLQLKGTVWKPLEILPAYTVLTIPPDATNASASVRIINHLDEPLTLSSPECNNHAFSATLTNIQPGKEYQLTIASVAELNPGSVQGKVTLKTSSTKTPTLEVPFWANVQPIVAVLPQKIMLPQASMTGKSPTTVTIQNNSTNLMTLKDPSVNAPGVEVQIKEVQPGKIFNAVLTFPPGFELPAGEPVVLTMKSSQPRMPEIRVPVVQAGRRIVSPPPVPKPQQPAAAEGTAKPTASTQAAVH